jgi:hypothetical protein
LTDFVQQANVLAPLAIPLREGRFDVSGGLCFLQSVVSSIGVSVQSRVMSKAIMARSNAITLVRRDVEPLQLDSLPANIEFIPGQMIVSFRTIEDLAQAMYSLARAIETDERLEFRDLSATKQLSSPNSGI